MLLVRNRTCDVLLYMTCVALQKRKWLLLLHAFTGCDVVSGFRRKREDNCLANLRCLEGSRCLHETQSVSTCSR